jgi:hypothetical protein
VLRTHPAWEAYQGLLERVAQAEYDRLSQGLPHDQYLTQCGKYQACRSMVDLVDILLTHLKDDNERQRLTREHARDHHAAITYGTPNWGQ